MKQHEKTFVMPIDGKYNSKYAFIEGFVNGYNNNTSAVFDKARAIKS